VVDGNACGGDGLSGNPAMFSCTPIPVPSLTGLIPVPGGTNVTLGIGDVSAIPILDDCALAETRATNCPRNLYAGRVLVYRHAGCTAAHGAEIVKTDGSKERFGPVSF